MTLPLPFVLPAIPEEHCQLTLHTGRAFSITLPSTATTTAPLSAFSTDLISSPRASYGNVFPLGASASAEPSVHDTHSKDAPWSSEHRDNRKGLRAPSDGNVILQAFYRHLNSPRAYLYMHTQAHTHAQQIQCCDSRVKPRYHAIIYA